jgi:hypothetical protein
MILAEARRGDPPVPVNGDSPRQRGQGVAPTKTNTM